jgi:hypothetical protein
MLATCTWTVLSTAGARSFATDTLHTAPTSSNVTRARRGDGPDYAGFTAARFLNTVTTSSLGVYAARTCVASTATLTAFDAEVERSTSETGSRHDRVVKNEAHARILINRVHVARVHDRGGKEHWQHASVHHHLKHGTEVKCGGVVDRREEEDDQVADHHNCTAIADHSDRGGCVHRRSIAARIKPCSMPTPMRESLLCCTDTTDGTMEGSVVGGNTGHISAHLATMRWNNDLDHTFSLNGTPTSEWVADRGSPCSRATCTTSAARTLV